MPPYEDTIEGYLILRDDFEKAINDAMKEDLPENPIYRAIATSIFRESNPQSSDKILYDKITSIETYLSKLMNSENVFKGLKEGIAFKSYPQFTIIFKKSATSENQNEVLEILRRVNSIRPIEIREQFDSHERNCFAIHTLRFDEIVVRILDIAVDDIHANSDRYNIDEITQL